MGPSYGAVSQSCLPNGAPSRNLVFLALVALLAASLPLSSAQYYVDSENGDDISSGASGFAWKSIDHACTQLASLGSGLTLFLSGEFELTSSCTFDANLEKDPSAIAALLIVRAHLTIVGGNEVIGVDLMLASLGAFFFGSDVHVQHSYIYSAAWSGPWFTLTGTNLRFSSCNFTTSTLPLSPPGFESAIKVVGGRLELTDCIVTGPGFDKSELGSAISLESGAQLIATNTQFNGLSSGAIYALSNSNASFTDCTFFENDLRFGFLDSTPLAGSAFYGLDIDSLIINNSEIISNRGRTAISVDGASQVIIHNSEFKGNEAPTDCAALRLIDIATVSVTESSFKQNIFGLGQWWTTCIFVKPTTALQSSVSISDSIWAGNDRLDIEDADLFDMTGYSLLFYGSVNAAVRKLDFSGENPWFSSVGAFFGANIIVQSDATGPASWQGYVAVCGNLTLETDMVMDGRLILSRSGECVALNLVDLGGHDLTIQTPIDPTTTLPLPDVADNWLQTGNFLNGRLIINALKTTVCCDVVLPETEVESDTVRFTDVEILAATTFAWGTSRTKFELLGSSVLNLEDGARLMQLRPRNHSSDYEAVIDGHIVVKSGAQVHAAGLRVNGTFDLQSASQLYLFPSRWRDIQHPLVIDGVGHLGGTIFLDLDFMKDEFRPNLAYDGTSFSSGTEFFEIVRMPSPPSSPYLESPPGLNFQLAQTSDALNVRPLGLFPRAKISNNLDALIVDWPLPMPWTDPAFSDCEFIFAQNLVNQWFSPESQPRCSWESQTRLIVLSGSLPIINGLFALNQTNLASIAGDTTIVSAPNQAVVPIAQPSVISSPCGGITLSALASTGLGSYTGVYTWSTDCAVPACASLITALSVNQAIINLDVGLFPGSVSSYTFYLSLRNAAGVDSTSAHVIYIPPNTSNLQVAIIGAADRIQPLNADLILQARFKVPSGCSVPQVSWSWTGSLVDALGPSFQSPTTSTFHVSPKMLSDASVVAGNYEATATASLGVGGSSYPVQVSLFSPGATLASVSSTHFSGSNPIDLTVVYTVPPEITASLRFEWRMIECAEEYAEASYRPVVSLNETIELPGKCQGLTRSFDAKGITETPTYAIQTEEMLDGEYRMRVEAWVDLVTGRALLGSVDLPFAYERNGGPEAIIKVVVPPPSALQFRQKIPIRLDVITEFAGTLTGTAITQHFSGISWSINNVAIDASLNRRPYLVLPYSAIQNGRATVSVAIARGGFQYRGSAVVSLGETPSGGSLVTSTEGTETRFSTTGWSSHIAGAPALRYQFFLKSISTDDMIVLSDPIDESTILTSVTSGGYVAVVRAYDVLDRFTEIKAPLPPGLGAKRQALVASLSTLETAMNLSDWNLGNDALTSIIMDQDSTDMIDTLVNSAAYLASSLPNTSAASSALLEQFSLLSEVGSSNISTSSANTILSVLSGVVSSDHSRFGSLSLHAETSSRAFLRTMDSLLVTMAPSSTPLTGSPIELEDITSELPHTLISRHADQVLGSTFPEEVVHYQGASIGMLATRIGVFREGTVISPAPLAGIPVTLSFNPSDWTGTASNGYIGFYHMVYNGTYPIATPSAQFTIVAETKFSNAGADGTNLDPSNTVTKSRNPSTGASGSYKTTFEPSIELLQGGGSPSCVSNSGGNWQATCTTTVSGNSVSCDCNAPTTLSLAFNLNDPSAPGANGKKSKLSAGAAAAIGATIGVLFLILLVILVVLFVPGAKNVIRPFRKRKYEKTGP